MIFHAEAGFFINKIVYFTEKNIVKTNESFIFWKNYNKRKYSRLHRRRFRPPVTNDEIEETFYLDANLVHAMQERRMIVLEHNIIPDDLGMGREKHKKEKKHAEDKNFNRRR